MKIVKIDTLETIDLPDGKIKRFEYEGVPYVLIQNTSRVVDGNKYNNFSAFEKEMFIYSCREYASFVIKGEYEDEDISVEEGEVFVVQDHLRKGFLQDFLKTLSIDKEYYHILMVESYFDNNYVAYETD